MTDNSLRNRRIMIAIVAAVAAIAIVVPEDGEIPADARVTFDPPAINIYADSWRVGREG